VWWVGTRVYLFGFDESAWKKEERRRNVVLYVHLYVLISVLVMLQHDEIPIDLVFMGCIAYSTSQGFPMLWCWADRVDSCSMSILYLSIGAVLIFDCCYFHALEQTVIGGRVGWTEGVFATDHHMSNSLKLAQDIAHIHISLERNLDFRAIM
jgi:hypothetical protein